MTKNHHEIIICGAGMIGLTFALLMAEKKIKVCIIDKNDKRSLFAQQDNRTTAISVSYTHLTLPTTPYV